MALSVELLEIIVCPNCKGKIRLREDGEALLCDHCRLAYAIRDQIPVMLIDEAERF